MATTVIAEFPRTILRLSGHATSKIRTAIELLESPVAMKRSGHVGEAMSTSPELHLERQAFDGRQGANEHGNEQLGCDLEFFPSRLERWFVRRWYLLLAPVALLTGVTTVALGGAWIGAPYFLSLLVALVLCAIAFQRWQRSVRVAFGSLQDRGSLKSDEPADAGNRMSKFRFDYQRKLFDKKRFILISGFVLITFVANLDIGLLYLRREVHWLHLRSVFAAGFELIPGFLALNLLIWSYAVGAVGWCLLITAICVAKLPKQIDPVVQPGHPDGCGGLKPFGNLALYNTFPLLIGMMLSGFWSVPVLFERFVEPTSFYYETYLLPTARIVTLALAVFSIFVFIAPVYSFHVLMRAAKESYERLYSRQLGEALADNFVALAEKVPEKIKDAADQLKCVQQLDPNTVKMSDWPFDKQIVIKYAISPCLSLSATFGKELWKWLQHTPSP